MQEIILPKLDLDMDKGLVSNWLKKNGEQVKKDEPILVIESEKITHEIPSPADGTLQILVEEGNEVPVGYTIAMIVKAGETQMEAVKKKEAITKIDKLEAPVRVSPLARRLAKQHNIDLSRIEGSGPGGRIIEKDIREVIDKSISETRISRTIPLRGIRKTIADNMIYSARNTPQVTLTMDVDAMELVRAHEESGISYNAYFIRATAETLEEFPELNSTLEDDQIKIFKEINIGLAVASKRGLIVPVIRNANRQSLKDLAENINKIVDKTRKDDLSLGDVTRGTFTITNLGMFGVKAFTPIVTPKQTAILGIGMINKLPVVAEKGFIARPIVTLSLSFDHRIVDGAFAAQFLQQIKNYLENLK